MSLSNLKLKNDLITIIHYDDNIQKIEILQWKMCTVTKDKERTDFSFLDGGF